MSTTKQAKHTPGPWSHRVGYTNGEPVSYEIEAGVGHIATVWMAVDSEEQDEANVNLMAAGPEMYAALNAVVADLGDRFDGPTWALIRAAIIKAEGR